MKTDIVEKKIAAVLASALRKLPRRIKCPKCGRSRGKEQFGLRTMEKDESGVPTRVRAQSWCRSCRSG